MSLFRECGVNNTLALLCLTTSIESAMNEISKRKGKFPFTNIIVSYNLKKNIYLKKEQQKKL